ncbi:hypothetical protein RhiirA5_438611 [Rhizophagus irregularis]|uniref:Uncharacterized protein n=1 Tax=Rhizophagus irregularis TaxID=588596 RepID=A0A2N0NIV1_9GLOM|nr:hypothetical protein RhiirA5_438611 [Rhizophagus irregularis]
MFEYQRLMKDFDRNMMDIVSEPQLKLGDKELVQITTNRWILEIRAYAGSGRSKIYRPKVRKYDNKSLLQKLAHASSIQAIPIFEILHPSCVGLFCFNQSMNHNAMAADALIAVRMNLSSGGAQSKMRDGWYINENREKLVHLIVFSDNHKLKGKLKDDIDSERLDCYA